MVKARLQYLPQGGGGGRGGKTLLFSRSSRVSVIAHRQTFTSYLRDALIGTQLITALLEKITKAFL